MADIKNLIEGYKEFYKEYFESESTLYEQLTKDGQAPKTLVVACSDSRVDPSIIMNAEPGDIFMARNVANLVPPYEIDDTGYHGMSAVLEFAVNMLEVENIIILGHSNCAGIKALLEDDEMENTDFIGKWMNIAMTAKERAITKSSDPQNLQHKCEKEGIIHSLDNLMTFPWIKSRVEQKELTLHGWYFTLEDGMLREYSRATKKFESIL